METTFFVVIGSISIACIWVIIKMIANKVNGKDELDGVLDFKKTNKKLKNKKHESR